MSYLAIVVALTWIGLPIITGLVEGRDPVKSDVRRMADRDRQSQAVRMPQRRMQYAQIVKPPLLAQRRQPKGQM
jgi:hypothetical protein